MVKNERKSLGLDGWRSCHDDRHVHAGTVDGVPGYIQALKSARAKVIGDLVFSFTGKETLRLVGITDPEDLRKLVENMQIDQRTMLNS